MGAQPEAEATRLELAEGTGNGSPRAVLRGLPGMGLAQRERVLSEHHAQGSVRPDGGRPAPLQGHREGARVDTGGQAQVVLDPPGVPVELGVHLGKEPLDAHTGVGRDVPDVAPLPLGPGLASRVGARPGRRTVEVAGAPDGSSHSAHRGLPVRPDAPVREPEAHGPPLGAAHGPAVALHVDRHGRNAHLELDVPGELPAVLDEGERDRPRGALRRRVAGCPGGGEQGPQHESQAGGPPQRVPRGGLQGKPGGLPEG